MRPDISKLKLTCLLTAVMLVHFDALAIQPGQLNPDACARLLETGATGAAQPPVSLQWTPDLSTLKGRIELLMSILERHPNFVTANLSFRRNVLDTLSHVPEVIKALGDHAQSLEIIAPQVLSASFYARTIQFNESQLSSFRRDRENDLKFLSALQPVSLSQNLRNLKGDKKAIKALFKVLPFLFDSNGNATFSSWNESTQNQVSQAIHKSTPSDLENGYFDLLREHIDGQVEALAKERGMGELRQFYRNFKSQFVEKEMQQLIRPQGSDQGAETLRTVSIESLPASVAIGRGCYGGDCSILSVPFYPLPKGVTAHFIRKSKDLRAKPDGYVLSVKVQTGSRSGVQTIPYILTVNGATLTEADVKVAIDLVMKSDVEYQSDLIAFPDWSKNANLVNWDHSRRAMTLSKGKSQAVKLPEGWNTLVEYHNLNNRTNYTNYYGGDSISNPIVGTFSTGVQMVGQIENTHLMQPGYLKSKRIEELPALERAIVAGQALQDSEVSGSKRKQLFQVLQVTEAQVQTGLPLLRVSPSQWLTLAQYRDLEREFGFGLRNILSFEVKTRGKVLASLYEESTDLFTEHRARDNQKIRETLINHYGNESYKSLVEAIWDMRQISDQGLTQFLKASVTTFGSNKAEDYIRLSEALNESNPSPYISQFLAWAYLASVNSDASLARGLPQILESSSQSVRAFGQEVMNQAKKTDYYQKRFPILAVYLEVVSRPESRNGLNRALEAWAGDAAVSAAKKADFMMTLIGTGEANFNRFYQKIQRSEFKEFWARMDQRTCFRPYYELAQKKQLTAFVLEHATLETFLYSSDGMPTPANPKTFEMGEGQTHLVTLTRPIQAAVAPETDILWELIMGSNPSRFAETPEASQSVVAGIKTSIGFSKSETSKVMRSSNRPVENVSWWSVAEYLNRKSTLEGLAPVFDFSGVTFSGRAEDGSLEGKGDVIINWNANGYRMATEAEQECFIRGGTKTRFPNGEDESKLPLIAWFEENSGKTTHPIGELRPNAFGLVDTSGNVWEWGMDWYADYSNEAVTDPMGPSLGSLRVVRGGSWYYGAQYLCSAYRYHVRPDYRFVYLGFRAVRPAR